MRTSGILGFWMCGALGGEGIFIGLNAANDSTLVKAAVILVLSIILTLVFRALLTHYARRAAAAET